MIEFKYPKFKSITLALVYVGRIFSFIHVKLNNVAILALIYLFSCCFVSNNDMAILFNGACIKVKIYIS